MSLRASKPNDGGGDNPLNDASWLYSYADLMTQLLLFSILMLTVLGFSNTISQAKPEQPAPIADASNELEKSFREADLAGVVIDRTADRLIVRMTSVLFKRGDDDITDPARKVLDEVARFLNTVPNRVRVEGHTDDTPIRTSKFPSNWELSTARAISVVRYLDSRGVDRDRLSVAGYGEFHPIAANDSSENRALNRRVEIVILSE